jgi:prophage regulatory protein
MVEHDNTPSLISMNDLMELTSLSRTGINNKRRTDPTFPKAVPLSEKRIAFVRGEAVLWVRARIAARGSSSEAA